MAVAGLIVGGVALASLFSTCVEAFEDVQVARSFGSDVEASLLKLRLTQRRLTRWGESVRILDTPSTGTEEGQQGRQVFSVPVASEKEAREVADSLGQIMETFEAIKKTSKRFAVKIGAEGTTVYTQEGEGSTDMQALVTQTRALSQARHRSANLAQKTAWALYDKKHFNELILKVGEFVNELVDLFPAARETQMQLCVRDAVVLTEVRQEAKLKILEEVAEDVDQDLKKVVEEKLGMSGHRFRNMQAKGGAKVVNGDEVADEYRGRFRTVGNDYEGGKTTGQAKVVNGNRYGGSSVFAD